MLSNALLILDGSDESAWAKVEQAWCICRGDKAMISPAPLMIRAETLERERRRQ